MSSWMKSCDICKLDAWKYKCPKCNVEFCSLSCYRSEEHLHCSEKFYKQCIEEELSLLEPSESDDAVNKMLKILKRIQMANAGCHPTDFDKDGLDNEAPDSDDDSSEHQPEDDEKDLEERLKGVDLHDTDEVWERLTPAERADFESKVESGEILTCLSEYTPWWLLAMKFKRIIEEVPEQTGETKIVGAAKPEEEVIPGIVNPLPKFSQLFSNEPSSCVQFNLWNIIASYGCMVRFYQGDHLRFANEAAFVLVNLSTTLKYCTNFNDVTDALLSVEMEAMAIGPALKTSNCGDFPVVTEVFESRDQLTYDAQKLMCTLENKLAALSDALLVLKLAKVQVKNDDITDKKISAMARGYVVLTTKNVTQFMKKIDFMLAFVNRANENIVSM